MFGECDRATPYRTFRTICSPEWRTILRSTDAASQAAQAASSHVSILTGAINSAQGVAEHAEQASNQAEAYQFF